MSDISPTDRPRGYQSDNHQNADPSALTVAMLDKSVAQLREFYNAQLDELKAKLQQAHDDYVRVPTLLDRAIADTKNLFEVKVVDLRDLLETKIEAAAGIRHGQLERVQVQFEALALRTKDLDEARATALVAALAAAKELVGAANTNFTKQIDGLQTAFTGQIKALDEKVNDLRDRLTQLSGVAQGGQDARSSRRADIGPITGVIAAGVAILMFLATMGTLMFNRAPASVPLNYTAPVAPSAR